MSITIRLFGRMDYAPTYAAMQSSPAKKPLNPCQMDLTRYEFVGIHPSLPKGYNRHCGVVPRPARVLSRQDAYAPGLHPQSALDFWATFFTDPDGIRLELTNCRQVRRDRHEYWDDANLPSG
jgi:hypothetical protein